MKKQPVKKAKGKVSHQVKNQGKSHSKSQPKNKVQLKLTDSPLIRFLIKTVVTILILVALFFVTVKGTKWYFYDSDINVEQTDLGEVSIDGLKLGMNIDSVDLSKYTPIETVIEDCEYNFKELSIGVNLVNEIDYIYAPYKKTLNVYYLQPADAEFSKNVSVLRQYLGENYTTDQYKKDIDNSRKIAVYTDKENGIHLGLVYSRYNNEMLAVILSKGKIKN